MKHAYLLLCLSAFFISSCSENNSNEDSPESEIETVEAPVLDSIKVLELADSILQALKKADYLFIGDALEKNASVRMTPYGMVHEHQNSLNRIQLYSSPYVEMAWGNFEGSPRRIQMSVKEYFETFVYDYDYANDSSITRSYNRFAAPANERNNLKEFYPDEHFVEYYYPGSSEVNHSDWSCLRMVFRKVESAFALVGFVHDEGSEI